jgi:RpiB/LacA/LacB family sugar-phosphate isomerase
MRLALASDHAGYDLKQELAAFLSRAGHEVEDLGTHSREPVDYPDAGEAAGEAVRSGRVERAIVVCGSGAGVSIAANKIPGVRAAVCHDTYTAHQAVEHDDLNVLCMGSRVIGGSLAAEIVTAFLAARFSGEERHRRRLDKVLALERRNLRT